MTDSEERATADAVTLRDQLKDMILRACRVRGVSREEIRDSDPLIGGPSPLQLDSLDALEITIALRREFGIELTDAEDAVAALQSIDTLTDLVARSKHGPASGGASDSPAARTRPAGVNDHDEQESDDA